MASDAVPEFTAAVLEEGADRMKFESVRLVDLRPDEVLVRIVASGICHSDIAIIEEKYPIEKPVILGHEGSGIVEQVGSGVSKVAPGDPVVLTFTFCGECRSCNANEPAYCHAFGPLNVSGFRADGSTALASGGKPIGAHFFGQSSFAVRSVANQHNVVKVRRDAPLELLGPFGCGIQTGAGAVLNSLGPKPGQSLVVFGGGGVGLSAVMAGVIAGCDPLILSEPNPARRQLGLELGATAVIDPLATADLAATIIEMTGGGADFIFDTSGIPGVIDAGIVALAPRGTIGLVAFQDLPSTGSFQLVTTIGAGKKIRGICEGDSVPDEFIPILIDHFMAGRFPVDRLVEFYDFDDLNQALEDQAAGVVVKPIVRIGSEANV